MFIDDLASRLATRVQLTSDGLKVYLEAIEGAFGCEIDYAMLVKNYAASQEETRYSPAVCTSCESKPIMGHPDPTHISTSFVERQNLTMRMSMRRFTRLTNGFSKKVENHAYSVAIHYMHLQFLPHSPDLARYTCDGSRNHRSCVDDRGNACQSWRITDRAVKKAG
jgi:hypothetical protein